MAHVVHTHRFQLSHASADTVSDSASDTLRARLARMYIVVQGSERMIAAC
jgi:hypothetical protein